MTPPDPCFDYVRPKGEIICSKDEQFEIKANGCFTSRMTLWQAGENEKKQKHFKSRSRSLESENSDEDTRSDEVDI